MKAINIWVTRRCNLNCEYCYESKLKNIIRKESDIGNVDEIVDFVLRFIKDDNDVAINFHGGEPLIKIDYIDRLCNKLEMCDNKNFIFSLTTNGTLLNKQSIQIIKKHKIYLSISIDGDEKSHNKFRKYVNNKGSYHDCLRGVKLAQNNGIEMRVRMTITPDNCSDIKKNVLSISKLGLETIVAVPDFYDNRWNEEMIYKLEDDIKQIFSMNDISSEFVFFEETCKQKGTCYGGINEINIDTNLDLYPCVCTVGNKEYKIGNILLNDFNENVIKKIHDMSSQKIEECDGCEYMQYCFSNRCRLYNEVLTGDSVQASAVVCAFENMIYRLNSSPM